MDSKQKKLLEDILGIRQPDLSDLFGLRVERTVTVAPAPKPAKITVDELDQNMVAIGFAKVAAYVEIGWKHVGNINSNGKPIAAIMMWMVVYPAPYHPEPKNG